MWTAYCFTQSHSSNRTSIVISRLSPSRWERQSPNKARLVNRWGSLQPLMSSLPQTSTLLPTRAATPAVPALSRSAKKYMNSKAFIQFAKKQKGVLIDTAGRRNKFQVEVSDSRFEFIIESGARRNESLSWVEKFCERFEEIRSEELADYRETRNASYLIGLMREFQKQK
jgi:hypothetical protein